MSDPLAITMHHLKPAWWLCIWAHFLLGSVIAAGSRILLLPPDEQFGALVAGGLWAVCLGGAGAALKTGFDPEKPGTQLRDATSPPRYPAWAAVGLMLAGLTAAPVLSWWFFDIYLAGVILVALYAAPPVRLARWPWTGAVVEAVGLGALTLHAGRTIIGETAMPERWLILCFLGFAFTVLALKVLFAKESRGLMPLLYAMCLVNAFVCLALGGRSQWPRWGVALLVIPFLGWFALGVRRYLSGSDIVAAHKPETTLPAWACILVCLLTDGTVLVNFLAMHAQPSGQY